MKKNKKLEKVNNVEIKYLGHSCFLIKSNELTIITDPYNSRIGFALPKNLSAEIVTVSHSHNDHSEVSLISDNPIIIDQPGKQVVKGIEFYGFNSFHDAKGGAERGNNIIFKFELDGITICHLGDLGHILDDRQVAEIGKVDILMIPVGGTYTINPEEAVATINQLKPKTILPMHYQTKDLALSKQLEPIEKFLSIAQIPFAIKDELIIKDINNISEGIINLKRNI